MYDQLLWRVRESLWNICRLVNKLVNYLDMPKGPQAQKHIFCDFGHLKVQKVDFVDYVRNEAMLVLVFYLFSKRLVFYYFRRELIWFIGEK